MVTLRNSVSVLMCAVLAIPFAASAAEQGRRIEEIVVTAEKRESTVSDTSISITAFGQDMIEDFGLQGADELVNFLPATTRDAYDIRIRGVGRNFRALGGDPGVATYYNGIYSEDFGIASSENGLYDVERIEVLRGPQGTLYGRNSIGGALNYITNKPSNEFEGELRTIQGSLDTKEYYAILSGPIVKDKLAFRAVGNTRQRDPSVDGMNGSDGTNSIHDRNFSMALQWNISDTVQANVRWNDRSSDRIVGSTIVLDEGWAGSRGTRNVTEYARGLVPTTAAFPGAIPFAHPNGTTLYGRPVIPGVDIAAAHTPNSGFGLSELYTDSDVEDGLRNIVATNDDNNEKFTQNAVQFDISWDINETTTLKYLGGWMDFDYTFDIDLDFTNGEFSQPRQTVLEAVETYSHELQLLWQIGDSLQMTSGLYYFHSARLQNYAFRDLESQGRYTDQVNYGLLAGTVNALWPTHVRRGAAATGTQVLGQWSGDPTGAYYEYWNKVDTDAVAAYTQGTYTFNEQWALTAGVRWAEDEKEAFEDRTGYFELNPASFGLDLATTNFLMGSLGGAGPTCALTDRSCSTPLRLQGIPLSFADAAAGEDEWGDTSFRVNLDWTPNEDMLIYLSATTGYRAGGYSLGIGDSRGIQPGGLGGIVPSSYDQEEVMAYELGYKGTHLDGQLQLNLSAYQYTYDNYQDRIPFFSSTANASQDVVVNADEAENSGFEVELMWLASDNLTIGMNGSYTKTKYKSDQLIVESDNPLYPEGVFIDAVPGGRDAFLIRNLNGNELKRIPAVKYTVWASYEWTFDSGSLTAGFTHAFTGEYYSEGIERDLDEVPERRRTDVRVTWRESSDRWVVSAFVDNVFDRVYTRGIGSAGEGSNYRLTGEALYPRFAGIDFTYRWGAYN